MSTQAWTWHPTRHFKHDKALGRIEFNTACELFMSFLRRLLNYRWTLSLLVLAVLPVSFYGAVKAWYSISNRVIDWLPDDFEATRELGRFVGLFGSDELLMISWEGCALEDRRIPAYRRQLLAPVETVGGREPLFREVLTGPRVLAYYESPPLSMSRKEALARMAGWIVSPDQEQTGLVALVSAAGAADRHAAVRHVFASADRVDGLSSDSIHVAGPTIEGVAIDEASRARLFELNIASFSICLLIMVLCLRSLRAALLVFLIALFNEQLSMALIHYCGSNMDSVLLLTANLTFVLTISMGIHLVNYYRDALETAGPDEAPVVACRVAARPTFLATATTALGLISLTVSKIKPITKFGAYSAVSIVLAMFITIVYTALHFRIWPLRNRPAGKDAERHATAPAENNRWIRLLRVLRWPLLLGTVVLLVWGFQGVKRLQTSVGLQELLYPEARVIQDYRWLERRIGPLIPVEVVLEMPAGDARAMLAQFRTVAALHRALEQIDKADVVISTATFAPEPPPEEGGFRQIAQAAVFRRKLLESQDRLRELGYLRADSQRVFWRLTLRTPATAKVDYGRLLAKVRSTVEAKPKGGQSAQPRNVIICGGVPLVYQAQQQLLEDLIHSFLLAFGLVSVTLMLLFRSIWCGFICMIPNVLPSAVVFGTMGWRGTPIEIGAILTASAALGIAVDDTLHFITWFRRKIVAGGSIAESVLFAYRRCATAMVETTLICTFGLVVFALSPFAPMARFGLCMFALLMTALAADLVILPAILLSPLGRPFVPRSQRLASSED